MAPYSIFNSILRAIKRAFSRSPVNRQVRQAAVHPTAKGPRGGARFVCNDCREDFAGKEVQVDHIEPVIPIGTAAKDMSWDEIIERLFCTADNLQLLCVPCHKLKSAAEASARKRARASLSVKGAKK
jgi:hypothetical protein